MYVFLLLNNACVFFPPFTISEGRREDSFDLWG